LTWRAIEVVLVKIVTLRRLKRTTASGAKDMLSVLIPVYNWDCRPLVTELLRQGRLLAAPFELVLFDDGSEDAIRALHRPLELEAEVNYQEMPNNLGRAAIRNALAEAARFPYLLFIDGDSTMVKADYLAAYLRHLKPGVVVYGGRSYSPKPPADARYYLHWHYGVRREAQPPERRARHPHRGFMTNNFCIPAAVFAPIGFDPAFRQYGHEDTVFGWALERAGAAVSHIDNPLQHDGLEPDDVFLRKQEQATDNLRALSARYPGLHTRLLAAAERLRRLGLGALMNAVLKALAPGLRRQLMSGKPYLINLDLLKLHWFLRR